MRRYQKSTLCSVSLLGLALLLSFVAPTVAQQNIQTVAPQNVPTVAQPDAPAVAQPDVPTDAQPDVPAVVQPDESAVAQQGVLQFRQQTLKAKDILDSLGKKVEIEPWVNYAALSMQKKGAKIIEDSLGNQLEISEWNNGIYRSKYLVSAPGGWIWYTQSGSANAGKGETGRRTTGQEWCRVRYLYGDDVRVPECWGQFMYSNHLITGVDGKHYELWFSPSSLSYFKIRRQEDNIWYAHDGSANDGRQKTTKDEWCRTIFYHMTGILKLPQECKETEKYIVNALAGIPNAGALDNEMKYIKAMMAEAPKYVLPKDGNNAVATVTEASQKVGGAGAGEVATFAVDKIAKGTVAYDKLNYVKAGGGPLKDASALKTGIAGMGVGIAVDYGVDAIKNAAGWKAKNANAGMIAAEAITTTVASTAITTGIMTAMGATLNPVAIGVGLLIAGGFAAGEEISKASADTGIRLEGNYNLHPRYNRDLNGISVLTFQQMKLNPTWKECSSEGGRCNFTLGRTVRYGTDPKDPNKFIQKPANGGIDCTTAAFNNIDPVPNVVKKCWIPE